KEQADALFWVRFAPSVPLAAVTVLNGRGGGVGNAVTFNADAGGEGLPQLFDQHQGLGTRDLPSDPPHATKGNPRSSPGGPLTGRKGVRPGGVLRLHVRVGAR